MCRRLSNTCCCSNASRQPNPFPFISAGPPQSIFLKGDFTQQRLFIGGKGSVRAKIHPLSRACSLLVHLRGVCLLLLQLWPTSIYFNTSADHLSMTPGVIFWQTSVNAERVQPWLSQLTVPVTDITPLVCLSSPSSPATVKGHCFSWIFQMELTAPKYAWKRSLPKSCLLTWYIELDIRVRCELSWEKVTNTCSIYLLVSTVRCAPPAWILTPAWHTTWTGHVRHEGQWWCTFMTCNRSTGKSGGVWCHHDVSQ